MFTDSEQGTEVSGDLAGRIKAGVGSPPCLVTDAGSWMSPSLGFWPEHLHETSPCGLG